MKIFAYIVLGVVCHFISLVGPVMVVASFWLKTSDSSNDPAFPLFMLGTLFSLMAAAVSVRNFVRAFEAIEKEVEQEDEAA